MPIESATSNDPVSRVLIVDDHPAVREGLAIRISRESDLMVCGEAADEDEALELALQTHPDVAVIDMSLPTGTGIGAIKRIREADRTIRILAWSMYDEALYAERAMRAGAMGYINKREATGSIIDAIQCVLDGRIYLSGPTTEFREAAGLSDRELQVFEMIGNGLKTAEIAGQLGLSVKTVETHVQRIRSKLHLKNTAELRREATRHVWERDRSQD